MPFQVEAAKISGSLKLVLAALQNVAGSQANMLAPQRVLLAAAATNLLGKEVQIIWGVFPPVAVSLIILVGIGAAYVLS